MVHGGYYRPVIASQLTLLITAFDLLVMLWHCRNVSCAFSLTAGLLVAPAISPVCNAVVPCEI